MLHTWPGIRYIYLVFFASAALLIPRLLVERHLSFTDIIQNRSTILKRYVFGLQVDLPIHTVSVKCGNTCILSRSTGYWASWKDSAGKKQSVNADIKLCVLL